MFLLLQEEWLSEDRVDRGAGPAGRTDEEEGKFTFPARSPHCRINRMEEGAAGGVLRPLDPNASQTADGSPCKENPWCFFGKAGV